MKLSQDIIRAIALGAADDKREEDGITLYRFTAEERKMYESKEDGFFIKSHGSAGIKLSFRTNSRTLFLRAQVSTARGRSYLSFDLFVNGALSDTLDNFSGLEIPTHYASLSCPQIDLEKEFFLGEGEKSVVLHLPWSKTTKILELSVDDGAFILPEKKENSVLFYGDSITLGFDALRPCHRWANHVADFLDAEEINKGIGGETYRPELPLVKIPTKPKYIFVAYGINDFRKTTPVRLREKASLFYDALEQNFPGVPVFVMTPIWYFDWEKRSRFDTVHEVEAILREAVGERSGFTVIRGFDLVPHDVAYFADEGLHPSSKGLEEYTKNLLAHLKTLL